MKILFWTDGFWPRMGGIETQAIQLIQGMKERGHFYSVIAQQDSPLKEAENWDIPIQRFDFHSIFPDKKLSTLSRIERYLETLQQTFNPDVLHLNACAGWNAFVFLIFRKMFSAPVTLTIHSPFFYQNESNSLLKKVIDQCDVAACVSNWVVQETAKIVPTAKHKLKLVHNGLASPNLSPSPLPFSPPTILAIGRFTCEKGFDNAIRAFAQLRWPLVRLFLVGEGIEKNALKQLTTELGIEEQVLFVGAVKKEEVPFWINQATLVWVPSYFESFGLVAVEAMQMQRPVIASAVGGLLEVVSPGETGLFVPPKDPAALAQATRILLEDPDRAVQMGKAGRKRALKTFSLEQHVAAYETIYNSIVC